MKLNLNFFNPENSSKKKAEKKQKQNLPQLSVSIKNGLFRLNELAIAAMGISIDSKIELAQDGDEPNNWFVRESENGFPLHEKSEKITGYFFSSKLLATRIADSLLVAGNRINLQLSSESFKLEGVTYWGLIYQEAAVAVKAEVAA